MLPPCLTVPITTTTADVTVLTGSFILRGWTFIETTGGAAAEFNLFDGPASSGVLVTPISLSSGESTRDYLPDSGLAIRTGLTLDMVSGSVRGALWVIPIVHQLHVEWAFGEWRPDWIESGV